MRLVQTSDTHLGHQQYTATDEQGLNQREQDGYAAFHHVIDAAIADPPDVFIHAGDLFDGVRPGNRALAQAMDGFLKLSRAGIPTVVIAGNHEHPKMRETGSPFRLFEHIEHVHPVYKARRETIRIDTAEGPLDVHAVPQCVDSQALGAEVEAIEPGAGQNVLVLHGAVHSLDAFRHAEFNELTLNTRWFDDRFDHVALGHYHGVHEVTPKAWYCGAPERVSMGEAGEEKGYLDVTLGERPRFVPVPGRTYVDLPALQADGLDAAALRDAAEEALARVPERAVVRLRLADVDPSLRGVLDLRAIQAAGRHALHLDLRIDWADRQHQVAGASDLRGLDEEFEAFAARHPIEGLDRARLLAMARSLLQGEAADEPPREVVA